MTLQYSAELRNALAQTTEDTITTTGTVQADLKVFDGAKPANTVTADAGTLLLTIQLPVDCLSAPSGGSSSRAGTWAGTATAGGKARYWRLYTSTLCHMQGPCAEPWASGKTYVVDQHVSSSGNVYICTSGGTSGATAPSGTGAPNDGGCAWLYLEPATGLLSLNNTVLVDTQPVTVDTASLNIPNS